MPFLNIQLMTGRTLEQKKKLVSAVTKAVCDSLDVEPAKVRIILAEIELENYAVAGKLAVDRK